MFVQQPVGGPGKGTFTVRNYYMSTDGKDRVCVELAKYTILVRPSGYLLVWNSTFSSDAHDFTFGDQEEFGLGIRVNTKISVRSAAMRFSICGRAAADRHHLFPPGLQ